MDFFCFKLSNSGEDDFANEVLSKSQNIEIKQLNQLGESLLTGEFVFINFGGDKVSWEKGLVGLAEIIEGPHDHGYDVKNPRNFKIIVKMLLVLQTPIRREEFIPYRDVYDAAGIGPVTRGEQNQAIKRVTKEQATVLIRAMLDRRPDIESEIDIIFPTEFLNEIKGNITMLIPKSVSYKEHLLNNEKRKTKHKAANVLLYGVPGSGKSYEIKENYCSNDDFLERVVFHPEYSYTDFIGQILPQLIDEKVQYKFSAGPFARILKRAYSDPDNMYYLVIEELNRGNAPGIFGDIFQLLDRDENGESEYSITNADISTEIYNVGDTKIKIPGNLTLLATMNTSDQNVFALDTAFKRRWQMKLIKNDVENSKYATTRIWDTNVTWSNFVITINNQIMKYNLNGMSNSDKRLGAYFVKDSELNKDSMIFPEKVLMYLWDDVFKFERTDIFRTDKYSNFEELVNGFIENQFEVFLINFIENEVV